MLLFHFKVFQLDPMSCTQASPRLIDTAQEARVMFQTIFEPIVFGSESDQHASRLAITRDDDLLPLSLAKIARQIVLDFGERNFLYSGFPNCASRKSASDLATIAKAGRVTVVGIIRKGMSEKVVAGKISRPVSTAGQGINPCN